MKCENDIFLSDLCDCGWNNLNETRPFYLAQNNFYQMHVQESTFTRINCRWWDDTGQQTSEDIYLDREKEMSTLHGAVAKFILIVIYLPFKWLDGISNHENVLLMLIADLWKSMGTNPSLVADDCELTEIGSWQHPVWWADAAPTFFHIEYLSCFNPIYLVLLPVVADCENQSPENVFKPQLVSNVLPLLFRWKPQRACWKPRSSVCTKGQRVHRNYLLFFHQHTSR